MKIKSVENVFISLQLIFYKISATLKLKLLFPLLLLSNFLFANIGDYKFIDVPSNNSLTHSTVECIVQDSLGFLWMGTIDGLNLYDGYEYRYFKYDPDNSNSISNNDISCLALQLNRYLWIGTRGGGANRMDLFTGEIMRFNYENNDGMIRHICVDRNNIVWIGTSTGLLKCIEDNENRVIEFKNVSENAVYTRSNNEPFIPTKSNVVVEYIFQHDDNTFYIGANVGVFEFNIEENEFHQISYHLNYFSNITKIEEDKLGTLWVASGEGVSQIIKDINGNVIDRIDFNSLALPPQRIENDMVEAMVIDNDGRVWVGTHRSGLLLIDNDSVIYLNGIIDRSSEKLGQAINELFLDKNGNLWIGQKNYPLKLIDVNSNKFKSIQYSNKKSEIGNDIAVQSITGRDDKIWLGTSAGIDIYDFTNNQFVFKGVIPKTINGELVWKNDINALLCDKDRNLWIGSSTNSLVQLTRQGKLKKTYVNGYIFSIIEEKERIWFGNWGQGIGYLNKTTGQLEQYNTNPKQKMGLSSNIALSLFLDSKDYLWVGTKGGGLNVAAINDVINRKGHFVSFVHDANDKGSISYNDVLDIIETMNGDIWLATGSGLNKVVFPKHKTIIDAISNKLITFEKITENDGLPSGIISSICEDNYGNLWLGTNNGLCRLIPETKEITIFNTNDGLPSVNFSRNSVFVDRKTNRMLFGGLNGVAYFQPDSLSRNSSKSVPVLTKFQILNKSITPQTVVNGRKVLKNNISYAKNILLKFNENDLSFEFSALNYTYSDIVRYQYRLMGYNQTWYETDSKNRRISYTNLPSGIYKLEIQATNSDGSWAHDKIELNIKIKPPFWLAWYAYLIYFLVVIFALFLFRKYTIIAVNEKNMLQLEVLEQTKKDEIFEAKTRFFINVSHEIRTPLTLIHEPLNQLLNRKDLPPGAIESAAMIRRNLKRLLNQVNQLLEFRKMEQNKYTLKYSSFIFEDVIKGIITEFEAIIKYKNIKVIYNIPADFKVEADQQLIETILYNLISNSLKYLHYKGELKIELKTNENDDSLKKGVFRLLVSDNGPGIPNDDITHIFERFYQPQSNSGINTGGTGIGLSIVKEYVEQHHGMVKVYNLQGNGCCFDIIIPVKGEGEFKKKDNEIVLPLISNIKDNDEDIEKYLTVISKQSLSMVIVEDDLDLSIYLKQTFSKHFKVTTFINGLEASEQISLLSPDIIICDLMLPGMNGLDLTARLKENIETSHIPIIMLTAISEEDSMTKGLLQGADCYLTKPFNTKTLKAQVVTILKSREKFRKQFSKSLMIEGTKEVIVPREEKFIKKITELIGQRMDDPEFEVPDIIQEMGMSHSLLLKKFKNITGMSLVEFIRSMRIKKAVQLFKQDKFTVSEVAYQVGFSDPKYFSKCFYNEVGEKPSEFVKRHHF